MRSSEVYRRKMKPSTSHERQVEDEKLSIAVDSVRQLSASPALCSTIYTKFYKNGKCEKRLNGRCL